MKPLLLAAALLLPCVLRADDAIPAKTLADIKGATVFIKMKAGPLNATGSGFLMQADGKAGYIVTNHHVVVPDSPRFPKGQLTVVFHSGTKKEAVYPATLLASDAERDLAVLKVADVKEMPAPLDLAQKVDLQETLPLYMFGFPFGEALSLTKGNPAITVGKGTISSIRLNEREEVGRVQIDGDLNPGNSGGPVVDAKGRLVGVAVARVRGTRIGLAIPSSELARMLNGRVASLNTRAKRIDDTTTEVEIDVALIDPLGRVKEVELSYVLERDLKEKPKPDKDTHWTRLAGGSTAKLAVEAQKAKGTIKLTAKEKGAVPFVFQIAYVHGEGKRLVTQATTHPFDFGAAVVKMPPDKGDPPPAPVVLKDKVVQALPTIGDVVVGGGGRFLIVHLAEKRKLAVWDVYQSKLVKELPLGADTVKLAAGMDKLIVVLPAQKLIQRWSLKTFERESTATLKLDGLVTGLAMGSASSGPLLLGLEGDKCGGFMDPLTLKPVEFEMEGKLPGLTGAFLRASANGQVFTARQGVGGEPHSCVVLAISGRKVAVKSVGMSGSMLLPTPDGQHVCSEVAIHDAALKPIFPRAPGGQVVNPFLPAQQGVYFLRMEPGGGDGLAKVSLFLPGHEKPFAVLDDIEGYIGRPIAYGKIPNPMMHDKRVFLVPEAKMLVTVPLSNDRLIVRPIDLDALLMKSGQEFLFVESQPPATARESTVWTYQVKAKSNKGGVKVKLESGPKGMKVSPQGLVEWEVPKKPDRAEFEVVLAISDAAGQEIFHTFTIQVE